MARSTQFDDIMQADKLLGAGLPPDAAAALNHASACYADDDAAERYLFEAYRIAPDHAAVLIGLYRFYFYKNRLTDALGIAATCLAQAARDNGLALDWRRVRPGNAAFGSYDARLPRFYMFTLKAYAYLQLRLGDRDEGRDAVMKLLELDPTDKMNAHLLLDVLVRAEQDDE